VVLYNGTLIYLAHYPNYYNTQINLIYQSTSTLKTVSVSSVCPWCTFFWTLSALDLENYARVPRSWQE